MFTCFFLWLVLASSQSGDPLRHTMSLFDSVQQFDNVQQVYNLGAGTSHNSTVVEQTTSPTSITPNAGGITSPHPQVAPDAVIHSQTVNADVASIPAPPPEDEMNVRQNESVHSMSSATHLGDDSNAAAAVAVAATAENTPAEEVMNAWVIT